MFWLIIIGYVLVALLVTAIMSLISGYRNNDNNQSMEVCLLIASLWPIAVPMALVMWVFISTFDKMYKCGEFVRGNYVTKRPRK